MIGIGRLTLVYTGVQFFIFLWGIAQYREESKFLNLPGLVNSFSYI